MLLSRNNISLLVAVLLHGHNNQVKCNNYFFMLCSLYNTVPVASIKPKSVNSVIPSHIQHVKPACERRLIGYCSSKYRVIFHADLTHWYFPSDRSIASDADALVLVMVLRWHWEWESEWQQRQWACPLSPIWLWMERYANIGRTGEAPLRCLLSVVAFGV